MGWSSFLMNFNDFLKGMLREQKEQQSVPSDQCEGSGKMSKEQGNALGVSIYKWSAPIGENNCYLHVGTKVVELVMFKFDTDSMDVVLHCYRACASWSSCTLMIWSINILGLSNNIIIAVRWVINNDKYQASR